MFAQPGLGYVYLIYGMHYCFNIVTAQENLGEAVLVRALEPLAGIDIMEHRRGIKERKLLCSGPARLCKAMSITTSQDGIDLGGNEIFLLTGNRPARIVTTNRIGISLGQEMPYRFYIADNKFISKK